MFHVKQAPVEKTTPDFAAAVHQGMAARLEGHHRQGFAQLPQLLDIRAVQPGLPVLAGMLQASAAAQAIGCHPFRVDLQGRGSLADQPVTHPPAEAAPVGQQVQGFQDGGLAAAVIPGQQVETGQRGKFGFRESTEIVQQKAFDQHAASRAGKRQRPVRTGRCSDVPRGTRPCMQTLQVTTAAASPRAAHAGFPHRAPAPRNSHRATASPRIPRAMRSRLPANR